MDPNPAVTELENLIWQTNAKIKELAEKDIYVSLTMITGTVTRLTGMANPPVLPILQLGPVIQVLNPPKIAVIKF